MAKIIDFYTGKPVEIDAGTTVEAPSSTSAALDENLIRRGNLIRRQIYEAISTSISAIDGQNYTFLDWIDDSGIFEADAIEEGGFLSATDREFCYKYAENLAPLVDKFVIDVRKTIIGSV